MRNSAGRTVLNSALYVNEVSAALITEWKKRTAAEHTVEKVPLYFVAGEVFTFLVFEVFTAVFHNAPRKENLILDIIIIPNR